LVKIAIFSQPLILLKSLTNISWAVRCGVDAPADPKRRQRTSMTTQ
jgi:hypothetical protein